MQMKRIAGAMVVLAALGGCETMDSGPGMLGGPGGGGWAGPPTVPGVQGPWGQPVTMAAPYTAAPPSGELAAKTMLARSVPLELMPTSAQFSPGGPSGIIQAGGQVAAPPPGALQAPGMPFQPVAPGTTPPPGAVAAVGALTAPVSSRFSAKRTEVAFTGPTGMKVSWFAPTPDGKAGFSPTRIDVPGRYNFVQAAIYRLKLSDIPNRPAVELYPTLEVVPSNARTDSFLAHSAVPITFTNEDLDQVLSGNYLVKVIYLPDPQFQDIAVAGPDEVVSSRLDPGVNPIAEAHRRGNVLLVVRMGNIDLELANSPSMEAPGQYGPKPPQGPALPGQPGAMPGGLPMRMGPNGPMMMAPQGLMMPPPAGSVQPPVGPVSKLPDATALQQSQFQNPTVAPLPVKDTTNDKPATQPKKWWWPANE